VGFATPHAPPVTTPHAPLVSSPMPAAPPARPVAVPPPSNVPVPTGSSLPTPVNPLLQPGAARATENHTPAAHVAAASAPAPTSQPPTTLVHPLGGSTHPPPSVSQPPRPSYAPQTVPSGAAAASADTRLRELQGQLVRARQELVGAQVELRTARGEADNLRAELAVAKARIEELEGDMAKAKSAAITLVGDDLKVIKGIGPKFEKLLRAAGITSVAQIATWSESELEAIAQKIGVKAERIRKDDWVGKAKRFAGS